jgi:predicted nucleotidyltransferase
MTKILESSRPAVSVHDFSASEIKTFLQQKLNRHKIKAAYIFGSFARKETSAWSDIDLLIVTNTTEPFLERARSFEELYELGIAIDILVYTPEEFSKLKDSNTGFWKTFQECHQRIV